MHLLWLFPLILFETGSSFRIESSSSCPPNQFPRNDGICCELCPIGTYLLESCQDPGSRSLCPPCKEGTTYMDEQNNMTMCKRCSVCDPETEVKERECDIKNNRQCVCCEGFHRKRNKCELKIHVEEKGG
uniref:TNFR-Cys domain-containing protein n=1 Tax=Eptatretus burgeri TaxID=7764 RepID=A0A8C4QSA9_EPTBU